MRVSLLLYENYLLNFRCPTCRFKIDWQSGNVDELPRNLLVEQMIAEVEKEETPQVAKDKTNDEETDIDTQMGEI